MKKKYIVTELKVKYETNYVGSDKRITLKVF